MTELVTTASGLSRFLEKIEQAKKFGFDVEATSSYAYDKAPLHHDLMNVVGLGFGLPTGESFYFPLAHTDGPRAPSETIPSVRRVLSDKGNVVWAHNMKYEIMAMRTLGIDITAPLYCSQIAQYSLGKGLPGQKGHKLKPAAKEYLGVTMTDWDEVVAGGARVHEVHPDIVGPYCGDDGLRCLQLGEMWWEQLKGYGGALKAFKEMSCEFARVLAHMREVGVAIDSDRILRFHETLDQEASNISEEFFSLCGVLPSKNQKLSKKLYEDMQVWPVPSGVERGKNGSYPINQNIRNRIRGMLEPGSLGQRIFELKERHSKISKLISTYTLSLVSKAAISLDGRLRCEFNQTRTATGRLSSSQPNLQNIPNPRNFGGELRGAFIAEEGWRMCDADYSQADLRMMAHLSGDEMLMKAYLEDLDLHQQTADACTIKRPAGKTLNLGLIYEMGAGTLAKNLGISLENAKIIHARWHGTYPGVGEYHEAMHYQVLDQGYVKTITGRIRVIPGSKIIFTANQDSEVSAEHQRERAIFNRMHGKKNKTLGMAFREASNTPCQGSVADVLMLAARNVFREWSERGVLYDYWKGTGKAKILSFVHDESICEFREDFAEEGAADLKRHMENAVKLRVPMRADPGLGGDWLEAYHAA